MYCLCRKIQNNARRRTRSLTDIRVEIYYEEKFERIIPLKAETRNRFTQLLRVCVCIKKLLCYFMFNRLEMIILQAIFSVINSK